jgi:hypothetical protein
MSQLKRKCCSFCPVYGFVSLKHSSSIPCNGNTVYSSSYCGYIIKTLLTPLLRNREVDSLLLVSSIPIKYTDHLIATLTYSTYENSDPHRNTGRKQSYVEIYCHGINFSNTIRPTLLLSSYRRDYNAVLHSTKRQNNMPSPVNALLRRWHGKLGLSRQSPPSWYRDRLREELLERRNAKTSWQKLSETSDVFFAISRARYDGFPVRTLPPFNPQHALIYAYMVMKYTLRWKLYQTTARLCRVPHFRQVCEVVNPSKDHKLSEVAFRHNIEVAHFKRICRQLQLIWPLLP